MTFAENLKKLRKEKGYSQVRLAGELGVVQGCVANWEAGTRQPKVSDLGKIARILGVSISSLAGVNIPKGMQFFSNTTGETDKMPLFSSHISAGFPSPADDYVEKRLNLNDLLIKNDTATFFVRVSGDSMIEASIHDGDILVVDKSKKPVSGSIIIAVLNGELTVKRVMKSRGRLYLVPENKEYSKIEVTEDAEFLVWGVVTNVIHQV